MIKLNYIGGGNYLPGIPARDIIVADPSDSEEDREAADIVADELTIKQLVIRHKGENPVLDEKGNEIPTGLYEYRDTVAPRPRRSRGG